MVRKFIKRGSKKRIFFVYSVSFLFFFIFIFLLNSKNKFINFSELFFFNALKNFNFPLDDVILSGRKRINKKVLLKKINLKKGMNIFSIDLKKLHEKLIEITWIKSVTVKRHLNGILVIRIVEREPIAIYHNKDSNLHLLVDETGYFIESEIPNSLSNLPRISGKDANIEVFNFLEIMKNFQDLFPEIHMLAYVQKRRWNLKLKNGLEIKLPEDNLNEALKILQKIIRDEKFNFDSVSVMDLRFHKKVILKINGKK